MRKGFCFILCLLFSPGVVSAKEAVNYCLDSKTNNTWARLLQQSPADDLIVRLFGLRIGLCELVKRKVITLERASKVFEQERTKALNERDPLGLHNKPETSGT